MPDLLHLEIATPEKQLVREEVSEAQLPGKNGYLGILPGHAALLSQLGTGVLSYSVGGRKRTICVHGGFVEISNDHVRVLANVAERGEEVNVEKARADLAKANQDLINPSTGVDPAVALEELVWAQTRVDGAAQK
jgi:F-type H+-transporting ATPase subunit epsilon